MSRKKKPKERIVVLSHPALGAILLDCRAKLDLALSAANLDAYPGPAWRKSTRELVVLIDSIEMLRPGEPLPPGAKEPS